MIRIIFQKYKNLKYRYKIALLTILAGMLPVAFIVAYMQTGMIGLLRERETDTMDKSVEQAVNAMENQFQIYENLIDYLSYSQDLRNVLNQKNARDYETYLSYVNVVDPLLEMPLVYHQEIKGITIYSNNIEVAHGTSLVPMSEIEKESWYLRIKDEELLEWFVKRGANREIVVSRKFYSDKDITAVLSMRLDYAKIFEPFRNLMKENTGGLICDGQGNVIYSSYSMIEEERPKQSESLEYLRENYVCSEQTMEMTNWSFCIYRPEKVITKSAYYLVMKNIPIVGVCILLLIALSYLFSRRLVSCLERLTENMNQVHMGFRKVTVHSESKDEVGTLIRSFQRMMDEINKLISEVYESKIELQHTEMRALQAQINPHFLYNSLSIINWKAIEANEDDISRVTLDLSTYYRTSLNRGETMTTVENEINNIRAYLRIQLIMHDNSFKVIEDVDESIFTSQIPKLILQPLVENAIDHGLDLLEKEEKLLWITVKKEAGYIVFQVRDSGKGMKEEQVNQLFSYKSPGYGVRNVYDRIKLMYKDNGTMTVKSSEGEGTTVEIRILEKAESYQEKNKLKGGGKFAGLFLIGILLISMITGSKIAIAEAAPVADIEKINNTSWEEAVHTPYGKYPETVTYTLGKISGANNSNMPVNATYENNAYTEYLKNKLNIQNIDIFELEDGTAYEQAVEMAIEDNDIPDVLVIKGRDTLKKLVSRGLIEDLSLVYEECTTDRIKEMYNSYGDELLASATFDGALYAFPDTVIDHGSMLLWMREDWIKELGLDEPKTLEAAMEIIQQFVEADMAGENKTIGLACSTDLVSESSTTYGIDPVFTEFGAVPGKWTIDENRAVVYGSVTEETKAALLFIHELYEAGIMDQRFLLRKTENLNDMVAKGECGAVFGNWWAPNNPLSATSKSNESAVWKPYLITTKKQKEVLESYNDLLYVVVRKGYEHPEIVGKYVSTLFDYTRYEDRNAADINDYFSMNVDPTARPMNINVDYWDGLYRTTDNIQLALDKKLRVQELTGIEKAYFQTCKSYLDGSLTTVNAWAAYASRIQAVSLLSESGRGTKPLSMGETDEGDGEIPQHLQRLEKETFLQIVCGEKPIQYFDEFVEEWYEQGGDELTKEIEKSIKLIDE